MVLSFKSAASEVLRVTKQVKEDKAIWVCNFHSSYTCFWNYSLFYLFIYLNCRFHFHKTHILVGLKVNCENNIICRDCILHFRVWEKPLHLGGLESFILRHKLLFFFLGHNKKEFRMTNSRLFLYFLGQNNNIWFAEGPS